MRRTVRLLAPAALLTALVLPACGSSGDGGSDGDAVTIYSGRNEELVGPLLEKIEKETGTKVEVRYGDSSSMAAQILEEGEGSPADLFFSQDAGALGALAKEDRLAELGDKQTGAVLDGYADEGKHWVATSARARVVVYDPKQAPEVAKMKSIDEVLEPEYKGKVGFAPTNASFHAFVTALRVSKGDEEAEEWLTKFKANDPQAYEKNGAVLNAVDSGEVELGLINHYYWYELLAEKGKDKVNAKIRFLEAGDPGALINVAGVGVVKGSDQEAAATKVVDYLLSKEAQQYFADETAEYPVVEGVTTTKHDLEPLDELEGASIDLNELDSLQETLAMLDKVGLT